MFTLFLNAQKPAVLRRLEVVLRAYTSVRLSELSEKQFLKAKKAINTPYQGTDESLAETQEVVRKGLERIRHMVTSSHVATKELLQHDGHPKIGKPSIDRLKMFTATHCGTVDLSDLRNIPYGRVCGSIASCTCWPQPFRDLYPLEVFDFIRSRVWSDGTDNDHCGHIGFIQEPGAKARVVAVPSALLQWGFEPLHRWLDKLLRFIPSSDVHDHNRGALFIEDSHSCGELLHCFDLSSATDRFPLQLQTFALEFFGLKAYAESLREICEEDFLVRTRFGEERWRFI